MDTDIMTCCIIKQVNLKVGITCMFHHESVSEFAYSEIYLNSTEKRGQRPQAWAKAGGISQCRQ